MLVEVVGILSLRLRIGSGSRIQLQALLAAELQLQTAGIISASTPTPSFALVGFYSSSYQRPYNWLCINLASQKVLIYKQRKRSLHKNISCL